MSKIISNYRFTVFFSVLAVLLGLYCYYFLPKQESPDVSAPVALITCIYPGASAEEVEKLVTSEIEKALTKIEGYDFTQSFSKNSVAIVMMQLKNDADVEKAWADLAEQASDIQSRLPSEASNLQINTRLADTPGMIISLSGKDYSDQQLEAQASSYARELSSIKGISHFNIYGQIKKELQVEIDLARLNQSALSLEDILNLLKSQNVVIPPGAIESNNQTINVTIPGALQSESDIENTIVGRSLQTGTIVRIKDLARVYLAPDNTSPKMRHNGYHALLLAGYFQSGENIVIAGQDVRQKLNEIKERAPQGLQIEEVVFQPDDVEKNISRFMKHLLEGMALVILVVLLGMGWKNALVASTAIPLSVLLTFIVMYGLGLKLHEISIAALIIVLGILVDDAIVMVDAIQVHLDQARDRKEACLLGIRDAAIPILTGTLAIIVSFSPLFFIPGAPGQFLRSIPQIVLISLTASYLVAMLVTPALAYLFFGPAATTGTGLLRRFFGGLLNISMKRKKNTLIGSLIILFLFLYLASRMGLQFFPAADKNILYIDLYARAGSNAQKTDQLVKELELLLDKQKEVLSYSSAVGSGLPKFYVTVPVTGQSRDYAQIMMRVQPDKAGRFSSNKELAAHLQDLINARRPEGTATVKMLEKAFPVAPVQVRVTGDNRQRLVEVSRQIKEKLKSLPGTMNIADDVDLPIKEYIVDLSAEKAALLGISNYDVQRQVNIALQGSGASVLRKAGKEYPLIVKSNIKSREELQNLAIKSSISGQKVLLGQISTIQEGEQVPTIKKFDASLAVTVGSDVKLGHSAMEIETKLKQKLKDSNLQGVNLLYDGESKQIRDNFASLARAALFALFLIYIVLLIQFKSFLQPLVIFLTLPLAIIGSILGLLIFRQPLSFMAFVGMVSLAGLVIRNAILLIEFINMARAKGMSVENACKDAVERRLRPIILSAVTATIGLLPLALSKSALFVPLAVALMFGLLVATILTMIIIPVMFSLVIKDQPSQ